MFERLLRRLCMHASVSLMLGSQVYNALEGEHSHAESLARALYLVNCPPFGVTDHVLFARLLKGLVA